MYTEQILWLISWPILVYLTYLISILVIRKFESTK